MNIFYILFAYLFLVNIIAFAAYGIDKYKAKKKMWRIPESVLLGLAAIGGALGAYLGMRIFRHKTKHLVFNILVPLFLLAWLVAFYYYL